MVKKIIIGFIAGIITGLFGAGGGMLLVPVFTYIFKMKEKSARATSIFCILPIVCVSGFFYLKASYIDWKISVLSAIGRNYTEQYLAQNFCKSYQTKR